MIMIEVIIIIIVIIVIVIIIIIVVIVVTIVGTPRGTYTWRTCCHSLPHVVHSFP